MEALEGRGDIDPTHSWSRHYMGVSGQFHAPATLCTRGKDPGTHWTGGWVDPRAGLDTEATGKILCPCLGSNPFCPVFQVVVRHYTDWATRLLLHYQGDCEIYLLRLCLSSGWTVLLLLFG
jgi:hypothetical protein